jgi:hypothetical protein
MRKHLAIIMLLPVLAGAQPYLNHSDTIGGSTYDWAATGPIWRMLVNDTTRGLHACWMYSAQSGPSYTDRNLRYNFYDRTAGTWSWLDPVQHMNSGTNSFTARTGYGSLAVNPATGCAHVSAHCGSIYPTCIRDQSPGSGNFEEGPGTPICDGYIWPEITVAQDGRVHCLLYDDATGTRLYYTRIDPWGTWHEPIEIGMPFPGYPSSFIEASDQSGEIVASWINTNVIAELYCCTSPDGGATWNPPERIAAPPAFPDGDTIVGLHFSSNSLLFDNLDRWHLVVAVWPAVRGQFYVEPAEIWHYCTTNSPQWNRIARAECDTSHLSGAVGYNALYAGRPMLAVDADDNLYCVWEQFDSANVEPSTQRLRANIFASGSPDHGTTWLEPLQLTASDQTSHRFPSVARIVDDNVHILYEQDLEAGFKVMSEGVSTDNPYVYLRVPRGAVIPSAVADPLTSHDQPAASPELRAAPNPFAQATNLSFVLPRPGPAAVRIYDASGRVVRTLSTGPRPAGAGSVNWNGTDGSGRSVPTGIYFARLEITGVCPAGRPARTRVLKVS